MLGLRARTETAWSTRSVELASWASRRLVNRGDRWATFLPAKKQTPDAPAKLVKGKLKEAILVAHFLGQDVTDLVGLPAVAADGTCKWFAIEVKRQGEDDNARPGDFFHAALGWHDRLYALNFSPVLLETGENAFLILALFDCPVEAARVVDFVENLTSDYGDHELFLPPRIFPNRDVVSGGSGGGREENWIRLPGRHFAIDHHTRVWDGDQWLGDEPAVAILLNAPSNSDTLLSRKAVSEKPYAEESNRTMDNNDFEWQPDEHESDLTAVAIVDETLNEHAAEPPGEQNAQRVEHGNAPPEQSASAASTPAQGDLAQNDQATPMPTPTPTPATAIETNHASNNHSGPPPISPPAPTATTEPHAMNDPAHTLAIHPSQPTSSSPTEPSVPSDMPASTEQPAIMQPVAPSADDAHGGPLPHAAPNAAPSPTTNATPNSAANPTPNAPSNSDPTPGATPAPSFATDQTTDALAAFLGSAQQTVDTIASQTGLRKEVIVSRVFEWVSQQDEILRAVILGQIPEALRPNVWKMIAEKAAA